MTVPRDARVVGIVLAAGASKRAGFPKALATLDGEALVARISRTLLEAGCLSVVVVVGPPHAELVRAAAAGMHIVENPTPEQGMLSSLRVALEVLAPEIGAAVIALVDHPRAQASTIEALIDAWRTREAVVARPTHVGRRGHPYLVDRSLFGTLMSGPETEGARPLLRDVTPSVDVEVEDAGILDDLDTPEGLVLAGILPPVVVDPRNG